MGRQIAIAMDQTDEKLFLSFLRESGDIAIYRSWSPTPSEVDSLVQDHEASPFWIHNLAFPWSPSFARVDCVDKSTGLPRTYFKLETQRAPLIEYSRHAIHATNPMVSGRLYWQKLFVSQTEQITYDLIAFDAWFTSVAAWIRKQGEKVRHGNAEAWFLAGARARLQSVSEG